VLPALLTIIVVALVAWISQPRHPLFGELLKFAKKDCQKGNFAKILLLALGIFDKKSIVYLVI